MVILGSITSTKELVQYYNIADLTVLTSKKETFGMVCVESLCCGTPVVAFKAGGTESIALDEFCSFAEFGDVEKMVELINKKINLKKSNPNIVNEIRNKAVEKYKKEKMAEEFGKIYDYIINKKQNNNVDTL